jgi:hypothetical protein
MLALITQALAFLLSTTTVFAIPTAQRINEIRTNEVTTDASGIAIEELVEVITIEEGSKNQGLHPICPHLNTSDHGCIRCRSRLQISIDYYLLTYVSRC